MLWCHECQNRKRATKFPHNSFLTLVQVFRMRRCLQLVYTHTHARTSTHTLSAAQYITLLTLHAAFAVILTQTSYSAYLQTHKKRTSSKMFLHVAFVPVDLYQPFLPAGRVQSPGGCESCLWCGPYACAPAHCGVPVCLPEMTRVTRPSAWRHSSGDRGQRESDWLWWSYRSPSADSQLLLHLDNGSRRITTEPITNTYLSCLV